MDNKEDKNNNHSIPEQDNTKNKGILDFNEEKTTIRKPKDYKVVLDFFVKTLYINIGLN